MSHCPGRSTVNGVDVSQWQGSINWRAVAGAGKQFAFARVADGLYFDPYFDRNWSGMKKAGLVRGTYQFFRSGHDGVAQANLLLKHMGHLKAGDIAPVLDVEVTDGAGPAQMTRVINQWVNTIKAATGRHPIIYTGSYFWDSNVGSSAFSKDPLWLASWGATCPTLPRSWSSWVFHQYSDSGSVPGISGRVDLDRFDGSLSALKAFAATPTSPPKTCKPHCDGRTVVDHLCHRDPCAHGDQCAIVHGGPRCVAHHPPPPPPPPPSCHARCEGRIAIDKSCHQTTCSKNQTCELQGGVPKCVVPPPPPPQCKPECNGPFIIGSNCQPTKDCSVNDGFCTISGGTAPHCVSADCLSSTGAPLPAHDICLPNGLVAHCDANGEHGAGVLCSNGSTCTSDASGAVVCGSSSGGGGQTPDAGSITCAPGCFGSYIVGTNCMPVMDCNATRSFCSTAGGTAAHCVSADCVATSDDVPAAHDVCLSDGTVAHCDANGQHGTSTACANGASCTSDDNGNAVCGSGSTGTGADGGSTGSSQCTPACQGSAVIGEDCSVLADCGATGSICSTAGGTGPHCVSPDCVASPNDSPVAHSVCLPDGTVAQCDDSGEHAESTPCPDGAACTSDELGNAVCPSSSSGGMDSDGGTAPATDGGDSSSGSTCTLACNGSTIIGADCNVQTDCTDMHGICSTAGGSAPHCVAADCVDSADNIPAAHDVCFADGTVGRCDATGQITSIMSCPAGSTCTTDDSGNVTCAPGGTTDGGMPSDSDGGMDPSSTDGGSCTPHCDEGVIIGADCTPQSDCNERESYCSTAGGSAPHCVSTACVSDDTQVPVAHDVCLDDGTLAHCDGVGHISATLACPDQATCQQSATSAQCSDGTTFATDGGSMWMNGGSSGGPCTPQCQGTLLIGADCSETDCYDADAYCSMSGSAPHCVSSACVANSEETPVEHDTCLEDGTLAHCDATGHVGPGMACPDGQTCVAGTNSASCSTPSGSSGGQQSGSGQPGTMGSQKSGGKAAAGGCASAGAASLSSLLGVLGLLRRRTRRALR